MKISCEIIKDLLPLYVDNLCSKDSKKLIEEHLLKCDSCKDTLNKMNMKIEINENEKDDNLIDAKQLKNLSQKWQNKLFLSMLKGIGVGTLMIILFVLSMHILKSVKYFFPILLVTIPALFILQILLSINKNKYIGLFIPILYFIFTITWGVVGGLTSFEYGVKTLTLGILVLNIPTIVYILEYYVVRFTIKKIRKNKKNV